MSKESALQILTEAVELLKKAGSVDGEIKCTRHIRAYATHSHPVVQVEPTGHVTLHCDITIYPPKGDDT